jgi:hypothetical protein
MTAPTELPRLDSRGLDFNNLGGITAEEAETFRESYRQQDGSQQSGFDFLIDHNPGALKTYRYYATAVQQPFLDPRYQAAVFGGIGYVAYLDFDEAVRYCVVPALRAGYTKAQIEEGLALSFMVSGTRGLVTIARALKDFDWDAHVKDPEAKDWPDSWRPDPAAFDSGVDFSTGEVLPGELDKMVGWYEQTIGWVPPWVQFYARYNPGALKGWRYRYEKALVTLPKQVLPMSLLFAAVRMEQRDALRENVLLAKAFGVPRDDVVTAVQVTAVYGSEKVSAAYRNMGDLLDAWDNESSGRGSGDEEDSTHG